MDDEPPNRRRFGERRFGGSSCLDRDSRGSRSGWSSVDVPVASRRSRIDRRPSHDPNRISPESAPRRCTARTRGSQCTPRARHKDHDPRRGRTKIHPSSCAINGRGSIAPQRGAESIPLRTCFRPKGRGMGRTTGQRTRGALRAQSAARTPASEVHCHRSSDLRLHRLQRRPAARTVREAHRASAARPPRVKPETPPPFPSPPDPHRSRSPPRSATPATAPLRSTARSAPGPSPSSR